MASDLRRESEDKRLNTLADSMARKAPSTMLKRANSLLRLTWICSKEGHDMIIAENIKGSDASLSQI